MVSLPSTKQDFVQTLKVHQTVYEASRGLVGHRILLGMPALMLRTTGRRTGQTRTNALVYGKDGDRLLVCASNGGHRKAPAWLLNLEANPDVEVQVGVHRWPATATALRPDATYLAPPHAGRWTSFGGHTNGGLKTTIRMTF